MSPIQSKPERLGGVSHRKTVRIVGQRRLPRVATWSLLIALALAIMLPALWRLGRSEEAVYAHQRALTEWETDWKCEAGHTFQSTGQIDERSCWICGRPAYPVAQYACPTHGSFDVLVRLERDADGQVYASQLRLGNREWVPADKGLRCPRCGASLEYVRDPLRGLDRQSAGGEPVRKPSP